MPSFCLQLVLLLASASAGVALADTDPSLSEVYDSVRTGHLEHAQKMMNQVLRDHPQSAKAHYVAAEVNAASGNLPLARQELHRAQELAPGLPFATPGSVRELEGKVSRIPLMHGTSASSPSGSGFPWSRLVIVVVGVGALAVLILVLARAPTERGAQPRQLEAGSSVPSAAQNSPPGAGTGIGSSIAGGLATGAGIVAGEEIAHHLLKSGEHEMSSSPATEPVQGQQETADLGGPAFGVSDASSWDDDDPAPRDDGWT